MPGKRAGRGRKPGATTTTATMADALRTAAQASGLSVSALARKAGVPQPVLHRFMRGERDLTLRTAGKLAAALGLALTDGGGG